MSLALLAPDGWTQNLTVRLPWFVKESLDDQTQERRIWWTKGLGAGGTYGLAIWHYTMCLINGKSRFSWSIAPTFQQVVDTLIPSFADVFQNVFHLTEGVDYSITTSGRPRIELIKRGQTINFRSANRADRMVGPSVSHISGTELGLWKREAYEKSSARLRCPKASLLQYLGEGTPEGFNWWQKEADFDEGADNGRNARRLILHTTDNRHLRPSYADNLRRTYEHDLGKLESYMFGRFVSFSKGTAYWDFAQSRNVCLDVKPSEYLPIIWGWDFNRSPLAWVAMQRQPFEHRGIRTHRFVILAESSGKARGIMDACAEFMAAFPQQRFGNTKIEVYGDPSGYAGSHLSPNCAYDQILQAMRGRYLQTSVLAARSAPTIQARLERTNQLFAYQLLMVAAWCRNTINSFTRTCLKEGTWQIEKPQGDDWTHYGDGAGYPLHQLTEGLDLENPHSKRIYGINSQI